MLEAGQIIPTIVVLAMEETNLKLKLAAIENIYRFSEYSAIEDTAELTNYKRILIETEVLNPLIEIIMKESQNFRK